MHDQAGPEIELTILMPCLNEAETVGFCIDKAKSYLQRSGVCGEVLIADNGSTDGSQAIAVDKGAKVVTTRDRGYGAALRAGIHAARGRYIVMGDADDSYDFAHLDGFVAKLRRATTSSSAIVSAAASPPAPCRPYIAIWATRS